MKSFLKIFTLFAMLAVLTVGCKKFLNVNTDPDRIADGPIQQLLTSAQVNLGFDGGSDLFRYSTLIAQQMSGAAAQPNQTYEYDRYNITGSDANNQWSSLFATTLNDLELIIAKANISGSPHYAGVAKLLKAYQYHIIVDAWGDVPYSEAQQLVGNVAPKYDKGEDIYKALISLIDQGIADLGATNSTLSPGTNSVIYPGTWATVRTNWIKFGHTLKLRLFNHWSKKDPAYANTQMAALIAAGGTVFMASNADNFQMPFYNITKNQNPIQQFEGARANYLFANDRMVTLMDGKADPRRPIYFVPFPFGSTTFKGSKPGDPVSVNYSRVHTYLRGAASGTPVPNAQGGIVATAYTYTGAAPIRMLTFAEYNFIRAEYLIRSLGAAGLASAQTFYQAGITASMEDAGVAPAAILTYIAANGVITLANALQKIIEEKYVANFGVTMESWTDWRRTGFPTLTAHPNANPVGAAIPRSLFYPQSEVDLNPSMPGQKADMQARVWWDTP